jgi:gamma-glutamyltranspeptidase/glutathione hydrolase
VETSPLTRSARIPATSTFYAPTAMVATVDHLATSAAVGVLRRGGSAADGAVAAAAVLAVTSPHACGLGGDMFALVLPPGGGTPAAVCGAGRSGSGADADALRRAGLTELPMTGDIRSASVPGCVDGWLLLHAGYGRLPLAEVLGPAAELADRGFPVSPILAGALADLDGRPVPAEFAAVQRRPGARLRRPGVAATLRRIAAEGRDGLYLGPFGAGLLELGGGWFTPADLRRPSAEWVTPLTVRAWGHDLWTMPPPSQGYVTLLSCAIAAGLPLPADPDDSGWAHLLAEAAVAGGHDRPRVLYDGADVSALLTAAEAGRRRAGIRADRVTTGTLPAGTGDTTQLCVVDGDHMAVSLMLSNAASFGTKVFEPATGIELNNRGVGFSLRPGDPGELRPGVRPPHTLCPALVTRPDGTLRAAVGSAGGDAQPHVVLQLLARHLGAGQPPGPAVGGPRFRLGALDGSGFDTWTRPDGRTVLLEEGAPDAWPAELAARGHQVHVLPVAKAYAGHGHLVALGDDGVLAGACEPRALTGSVSGF